MVDHPEEDSGRDPAGQGAALGERVAKALARAGVASRRDVERLIGEGRVALNGRVLDTPAVKVEPGDVLTVDGKVVDEPEPTRLWRFHKPVGLVTTHKDPQGRPTVFDTLPKTMPRVISIGRLDLNSEGLLLLTNDGGLARSLELPSSGWIRRYRARARGRITQDQLDGLHAGVTIDGVRYGAIEATLDKAKEGAQGANLWISVGLTEGKNREVRRVLEHLGLKVNRLIRLAYGPFSLGTLAMGEADEVGPRVIRELLAGLIDPANMPTGDRPQSAPARQGRRSASGVARPEAPRGPKARGVFGAKPPGAPTGPRVRASPTRPSPSDAPEGATARRGYGRAPAAAPGGAARTPYGKAAGAPATAKARPAAGDSPADAPAKKAYKPGWAKPKPRAKPKTGAGRPVRTSGKRKPPQT